MIRQSLSQKQLQKLSPRQIQLMKLIQIPTATLEQRIQEELEANPALDESEDLPEEETEFEESESDELEEFEIDDYLQEYLDDDPATYKLRSNNYSDDDEQPKRLSVVEMSFHDYLQSQVGMMGLKNSDEKAVIDQLIGSIDEDGYLRRSPRAVTDDLMLNQNLFVDVSLVERMLKKVQQLDPPGVGAINLQECLLLQIKRKLNAKDKLGNIDSWMLAEEMISKHFDAFSKKHYEKLLKKLDLDKERLKEVISLIVNLNPKPASAHIAPKGISTNYIVPDFFIRNIDGELELEVNGSNTPELRINDQYKEMLINFNKHKNAKNTLKRTDKEAALFIKQKIDSAKWFIDAIQQRKNTMYNSMYSIMQYQHDFFMTGDRSQLRPMILKDIADITGLDISTISRVANSKYVSTEYGTYHLKDFFSESVEKNNGDMVSTNEVKAHLETIISKESKTKPLSDEALKSLLDKKGYNIARRTVAKYREQLGIPVARLRKRIEI